jgi:hypothetical protein
MWARSENQCSKIQVLNNNPHDERNELLGNFAHGPPLTANLHKLNTHPSGNSWVPRLQGSIRSSEHGKIPCNIPAFGF